MQKELYFVTTNTGKFNEVKSYIEKHEPSIEVKQAALDIPEIQSLDLEVVARAKAQEAFKQLQKPLIVDDGGLFLEKYPQFPGALSKHVYQSIGLDGVLHLASDDKRAFFHCCLVYIDEHEEKVFEGIVKGKLEPFSTDKPFDENLPYRSIFIPEGQTQTYEELAEISLFDEINHRHQALKKLLEWIK